VIEEPGDRGDQVRAGDRRDPAGGPHAVLRAYAQILSVPPLFTEEATDYASAFVEELLSELSSASRMPELGPLGTLRFLGWAVPEPDAWRIADPLRGEFRRELQEFAPALFTRIAAAFLDLSREGLEAILVRALGKSGARLNLAVLAMEADREGSGAALDELVKVVAEGLDAGRIGDMTAAKYLLAQLPETGQRDRAIRFLGGLEGLLRGDTETALEALRDVTDAEESDIATATAVRLRELVLLAENRFDAPEAVSTVALELERALDPDRWRAVTDLVDHIWQRGGAGQPPTDVREDDFRWAVDRLFDRLEDVHVGPLRPSELQLILHRLVTIVSGHHRRLPLVEAQEVASEAMVKFLRAVRQGRVARPAAGYLIQIAKNEAASRLRMRDPLPEPSEGYGEDDEDIDRLLETTAAGTAVESAFKTAAERRDATVFRVVMAWLDMAAVLDRGPTLREVAAKAGVSHTGARNALQRFREYLPKE
jgi:DNA-directed RNA polymerase specialized sigma24 family protein